MITRFKIYEQSELTQFSDLTKMNIYIDELSNNFQFIVTDKENDYDDGFSRNDIRYAFNVWNEDVSYSGEPSDAYFSLDNYTKYNYTKFYERYKVNAILIYKNLQEKDIENIANNQQHDAFVLLKKFLEQISYFEQIKIMNDINI